MLGSALRPRAFLSARGRVRSPWARARMDAGGRSPPPWNRCCARESAAGERAPVETGHAASGDPGQPVRCSLIIATLADDGDLGLCLESLAALEKAPPFEV